MCYFQNNDSTLNIGTGKTILFRSSLWDSYAKLYGY